MNNCSEGGMRLNKTIGFTHVAWLLSVTLGGVWWLFSLHSMTVYTQGELEKKADIAQVIENRRLILSKADSVAVELGLALQDERLEAFRSDIKGDLSDIKISLNKLLDHELNRGVRR